MKRFRDVVGTQQELEGVQMLSDYIGVEFKVTGYQLFDTRKGPNAHLYIESDNGEAFALWTSSKVVIDQLKKAEDALPLMAMPSEKKSSTGFKYVYLE